jgi:hypothetical protein
VKRLTNRLEQCRAGAFELVPPGGPLEFCDVDGFPAREQTTGMAPIALKSSRPSQNAAPPAKIDSFRERVWRMFI